MFVGAGCSTDVSVEIGHLSWKKGSMEEALSPFLASQFASGNPESNKPALKGDSAALPIFPKRRDMIER